MSAWLLRATRCALRLTALGALGACGAPGPGSPPPPAAPAATSTASAPEASAPAPSAPLSDPYHRPPRDTVEVALYKAWQQYSLQCARCHGEDGQGTSFAPSLVAALKPDGDAPTREQFLDILTHGRQDKGMPSAAKM